MALPAHRVIGHKEYGNTGHPGRKSDPVYDMNWRRQRVAAFTPRSQEDVMNADQEAKLNRVLDLVAALRFEDRGPVDQGWEVADDSKRKLSRTDILRDIQHEVRYPFAGRTMVGRQMYLETQLNTVIAMAQQLVNSNAKPGQVIDVPKLSADISQQVTAGVTATVTASLLSKVQQLLPELIGDAMGADNAEQAEAVVTALGARLKLAA